MYQVTVSTFFENYLSDVMIFSFSFKDIFNSLEWVHNQQRGTYIGEDYIIPVTQRDINQEFSVIYHLHVHHIVKTVTILYHWNQYLEVSR